jgi:hypothetical protein
MARLGRNEQLVSTGSGAVVAAYVLGLLFQDWPVTLSAVVIVVAAVAALVLTIGASGRSLAGVQAASWVRIDAALVGAFALIDVGDLLSSLDSWETLTIGLTIVYVIGAAILAYGAWGVSGGNLVSDVRGTLGVMGLALADRLVLIGALGCVVGWFLIMWLADIYEFVTLAQVVVLAATLLLSVRWLDRNPTAGRLMAPAPVTTAALGAVAIAAGAWWFLAVIGRTLEIGGLLVYLPVLLFVLALVALAVGCYLLIGRPGAAKPAA